jgi:hypothetical protein
MKQQWSYLLLLASITAMLWALTPTSVAQSLSKGKGDLRVMTYNVDEGTDYIEVMAAKNA